MGPGFFTGANRRRGVPSRAIHTKNSKRMRAEGSGGQIARDQPGKNREPNKVARKNVTSATDLPGPARKKSRRSTVLSVEGRGKSSSAFAGITCFACRSTNCSVCPAGDHPGILTRPLAASPALQRPNGISRCVCRDPRPKAGGQQAARQEGTFFAKRKKVQGFLLIRIGFFQHRASPKLGQRKGEKLLHVRFGDRPAPSSFPSWYRRKDGRHGSFRSTFLKRAHPRPLHTKKFRNGFLTDNRACPPQCLRTSRSAQKKRATARPGALHFVRQRLCREHSFFSLSNIRPSVPKPNQFLGTRIAKRRANKK